MCIKFGMKGHKNFRLGMEVWSIMSSNHSKAEGYDQKCQLIGGCQ